MKPLPSCSNKILLGWALALGLTLGSASAEVTVSAFGKMPDGQPVQAYTLKDASGLELTVTNYGASVLRLLVPDRSSAKADVVLGFDHLADYLKRNRYFGSVIGRYAGRIADGQFSLGRETYHLSRNLPPDTLHGGGEGFDRRFWSASILVQNPPAVCFRYLSKDGEEGFPGNLATVVFYTLEKNRLSVTIEATTDRATVFNPTSHLYFNLAGQGSVKDHHLQIAADRVLELDEHWRPTGKMMAVKDTKLDFRQETRLGDQLAKPTAPAAIDHTYVLKGSSGRQPRFAAQLLDPGSGRSLKIFTDQPGLQLYPANSLRDVVGKGGVPYQPQAGVCLEPQHYPDAPNHPDFPSTVLRPGATFHSETIYEFSIR